jgi:hypothetical protein
MVGVFFFYSLLTRISTGDCQAGGENVVTFNRDVRPNVSQLWILPSTAERQRNGFNRDVHKPVPIMLKNINKMKEKAHRVKLSF